MRPAFTRSLAFVALLWAIAVADAVGGLDLARHGVLPRRVEGLDGILWAPLLHGSWSHLVANSAPALVLVTAVLYGYPRAAPVLLPAVYLGTGLAVWLFARPALHIGASGLNLGLLTFVFVIGVLRWERRAIAIALIVGFLYGSMIWGVLPLDPAVSFESHLAGAVIGTVMAFVLRWRDPPPPRPRYSWEDEADEATGEDPSPPPDRTLHRGTAAALAARGG